MKLWAKATSALSYFIGGKTSKITKFVEWCFRISSLRLSLVAAAHSSSTLRTSALAVVIVGSSDGSAFQAHNAALEWQTMTLHRMRKIDGGLSTQGLDRQPSSPRR